uniref:4-hydroxyphenylpyruvate dioxygenase n=1 Tax=Thaumasiovibrio occultus TaxID=1891184 RepID=UPI000B36482D|nr:4-hydroxyphenylpyruvate dioxygenase [Thaumasiovibrio occultus]
MQYANHENPLGTDGFEFVEFTAADSHSLDAIANHFTRLGFAEIAQHRHKAVFLFRQGRINFILNGEAHSQASQFAKQHGPSVNAIAFQVHDITKALAHVRTLGIEIIDAKCGPMELNIPAIEVVGGALLYLVERAAKTDIYAVDFEFYPDWQQRLASTDRGLGEIDHLTHNVFMGHMDQWADFYTRLANFREIRHFDIDGKATGLLSRAMISPCGKIKIPINESKDNHSQIAEYLRQYHGEGIQHIALTTEAIFDSVAKMRRAGVPFMNTPSTYYELLSTRLPNHQESLEMLKSQQVLIDGDDSGVLLQIFTDTLIGPIFFEVIQRKGNQGFGEGNFKALFESIELDQIRRGVI